MIGHTVRLMCLCIYASSNSMRCYRLVRFDKIEVIKIDNSKSKK